MVNEIKLLMPNLSDLQISLFQEQDVDLILQTLPQLQVLNNIPVDQANDNASRTSQVSRPIECQESFDEKLSEKHHNDSILDKSPSLILGAEMFVQNRHREANSSPGFEDMKVAGDDGASMHFQDSHATSYAAAIDT